MKTKLLLLAMVALFTINAVARAPREQESSPMQEQLAAVTLKIKGFLQQRKNMNVPQAKGAFETKFHETNAKCESYLHELEAFSISRGDLKPAFLRILTPEETAILKQELAGMLGKNPCPINGENESSASTTVPEPKSGSLSAVSTGENKQTKAVISPSERTPAGPSDISKNQKPEKVAAPAVFRQPAGGQSAFASPVSNLANMKFSYEIAVSVIRNKQGNGYQGGCTIGSGAITSDAAVWDVVISLVANQLQEFKPVISTAQTNGKGAILVPLITMDENTQLLVPGRKAYIGRAEQNIYAPKFHFRSLSLNEVTDLLQSLKGSDVSIKSTFNVAKPTITVYQILAPADSEAAASEILNNTEEVLFGGNRNLENHEGLAKQLAANAGKDVAITLDDGSTANVHIEQPITITYTEPQLAGDTADEVAAFASRLANLGTSGHLDSSKAKGERLTTAKGDPGSDPAEKPFVIENECFQLSFTPGLQNGGVSPAANFRSRISFIPEHSKFSLRFKADGEGSSDLAKPKRIAASGDVTYLSRPFLGGWHVTFGATSDYSYSQLMNIGVNEWRAGGKFELQTPVQQFFPVRSGNDQKPTFVLEGGAVGGSTMSNATNFIVRGDFVYTLQPSAKVFFDLNANAGASDQARFNGRKNFSFGSFVGRFAVYKDWDLIVKYACGRMDPLYLKVCGWQTGFGVKPK